MPASNIQYFRLDLGKNGPRSSRGELKFAYFVSS